MTSQNFDQNDGEFSAEEIEEVSKSQLKRDAQAVKLLARQLIELNDSRLKRVPLDEDIMDAVKSAREMRSHGARKRQMLFVAKKLRQLETAEIEQALESFQSDARKVTASHHRCEQWRDRLLLDGDAAVSKLIEIRPGVNIQAIRQWIRKSKQEESNGKPPAAARSLFRLLRELDDASPLPSSFSTASGADE